MVQIACPLALALRLAAFAPLTIAFAPLPALAQTQQDEASRQMALTDAQIQNYLAAQSEMAAAMSAQPNGEAEKPDPKVEAQLDAIVKKYKFASFDEYALVEANIGMVIDGIDPQTKKYVGADVVLRKQIAEVQANNSMAPADKKQALAEMNGALKSVQPLKNPANADLVLKYYDQFAAASGQTD